MKLDTRSLNVLYRIVELYLDGIPAVGSRTLSALMAGSFSPATLRNTMASLERKGLLFSAHASSGRAPTALGIKLYVQHLLRNCSYDSRLPNMNASIARGSDISGIAEVLAQSCNCMSIVISQHSERIIKRIELIRADSEKCLAVIVSQDGHVDKKPVSISSHVSKSDIDEAINCINAYSNGRTLREALSDFNRDIAERRKQVSDILFNMVNKGLEDSSPIHKKSFAISGQNNLLDFVQSIGDLEKFKELSTLIEKQEEFLSILDQVVSRETDGDGATESAGMKVLIGGESECEKFSIGGYSLIISPHKDASLGDGVVIGIVGPLCMNYKKAIYMINSIVNASEEICEHA
ncbi:HrcA family transcriptional regulator [Candidatus Hydrogenosomobacter endosymbioticus]|uniref:Heat-inducible transcription repressor HrcA n=1 Tax=Candidatus Hydrogenosomobacter endosymbioticus TaxID=2558174 RepID=A0ABM7V9B9_9PROT|nr:hypothetical protein [Candidatus Hydrogenosomobacter endosymbioticus]BDB96395.1 heat-inducible transcription repressor HrcA [Candidatus Hydrogenosomobacter endosymbioticus]